jgi:hypothetical protein
VYSWGLGAGVKEASAGRSAGVCSGGAQDSCMLHTVSVVKCVEHGVSLQGEADLHAYRACVLCLAVQRSAGRVYTTSLHTASYHKINRCICTDACTAAGAAVYSLGLPVLLLAGEGSTAVGLVNSLQQALQSTSARQPLVLYLPRLEVRPLTRKHMVGSSLLV